MLSPRQRKLILALVQAPTIRAACRRAGVQERCYRRWKDQVEFREALAALRQEAFAEGVAILKGALPRASRALVRSLRAKDVADVIRAAKAMYEISCRVDMVDLAERVRQLEAERERLAQKN